jgi:hypothetical protein
MKKALFIFLFVIVAIYAAFSQKIDPTRQIKRPGELVTPINNALNVANLMLITDGSGRLQYQPATDLNGVLVDEVLQTPSAPTLAPTANQGWVHLNTTNGIVSTWNGSAWNPISGAGDNWGSQTVNTNATLSGNGTAGTPLQLAQQGATNGQALIWNGTTWLPGTPSVTTTNGITNYTTGSTGVGLGGTLNRITEVNGANTYGFGFPALTAFSASADDPGFANQTDLTLSSSSTLGGSVISRLRTNPNDIFSLMRVANQGASLQHRIFLKQAGVLADENGFQAYTYNQTGALRTRLRLDTNEIFLDGIRGATNSDEHLVFLNNSTNSLAKRQLQIGPTLQGTGTTAAPIGLAQQGATTGQALVWSGTAWTPDEPAVATTNGLTNYTTGTPGIGLGGTLDRTTQVSGANTYGVGFPALTAFSASADDPGFANQTDLTLSSSSTLGGSVISRLRTNPNDIFSLMRVANQGASLQHRIFLKQAGVLADENGFQAYTYNQTGALRTRLRLDTNEIFLDGIRGATNSDEHFVVLNNTTNSVAKRQIQLGTTLQGTGTTAAPIGLAQQGATTGQVLKWNGSAWVPGSDDGGVGGDQVIESDNTMIVYQVASGSPTITASRTGGTQTISVSGGTVLLKSVATQGLTSDLAPDNSFKIVCNGVIGTSLYAYPVVSKWNLSNAAPSESVPHIQDTDNTPQIQVTAGTAGSSITVRVINLNAFTDWVIKMVW